MMKKLLFCLTVSGGLLSCNHQTHRLPHHPSDSAHAAADTIAIDSSLISLRAQKSAPLLQAICQLWKMDDVDQRYWNYLMWDSVEDKRKYPEMALFSDFSVTENARCNIRMGKWRLDKDKRELILDFSDGTPEIYQIKKILLQKMVVTKMIGTHEVEISFTADGLVQKQPDNDPFYPSNNQWRIKPRKPETEKQIIGRLKQCVHFYSLFFRDVHRRASKEISYSGLPVCFEWYNGGIGVPQELDLDKKWINCFYSEKDALFAYHRLRQLIERHELIWPEHPSSWVEETFQILDQLYDKL